MGDQRQQIQPTVIEWFKANPDEIVTLAELAILTGANASSSVSAVVRRLIQGNLMPGLKVVTRGVYKYVPGDVSAEDEVSADESAAESLWYQEVGRINARTVVLTDSKGNIWRAERLQ